MRQGTRFGFCFASEGLPPGGFAQGKPVLTKVVEHPPMTLPDGSTKSSYSATRPVQVSGGRLEGCEGYGFDHAYELVPGTWRFTMRLGTQDLVSQEFVVR